MCGGRVLQDSVKLVEVRPFKGDVVPVLSEGLLSHLIDTFDNFVGENG